MIMNPPMTMILEVTVRVSFSEEFPRRFREKEETHAGLPGRTGALLLHPLENEGEGGGRAIFPDRFVLCALRLLSARAVLQKKKKERKKKREKKNVDKGREKRAERGEAGKKLLTIF